MQQRATSNQKIFNNQYQIVKKLSSGSFGVVFLGYDLLTKQEVAIKVEKEENEEVRSLDKEVQILKKLDGAEGFPKLFWSGEDQSYNVLVIQLLGKDLSYHFKQLKKFSLKTVLTLGIQAVQLLERSHQKGIIHRDLKPENIILGVGKDILKLYLIDFGISKIIEIQMESICTESFKDQKSFLGTTRYASIAAHLGHELGRKDDLESLMYILLYLLRGQLPWQNMVNVTDEERTKKVGEMKLSMEHDVFKDQSVEFQHIFGYIRKLQFKQEPNYKMIVQEFRKAAGFSSIIIDGNYDWTEIKQSTHYQTDSNKNQSRNNIPMNSNEMKKSIENQLSGLIQSSTNNLLAPPPLASVRGTFQRDDIRKSSSLTQQSKINYCQSLNPKYQKSICEEPLQEEDYYFDFDSVEICENYKTETCLYNKYNKIKLGIFVHFLPKQINLK